MFIFEKKACTLMNRIWILSRDNDKEPITPQEVGRTVSESKEISRGLVFQKS